MKIRCDVCDKEEASLFCPSDEAALCDGCDRHVHRANKLATKHTRFSLLRPGLGESPLCDICQVRRAFLFCKEDRAILCRDCDIPMHKASEHRQKHSRFLLTGVKLSSASSLHPSNGGDVALTAADAVFRRSNTSSPPPPTEKIEPTIAFVVEDGQISDGVSFSTSSISEYLESLPGWRVEEFLDPSCSTNVFCEV